MCLRSHPRFQALLEKYADDTEHWRESLPAIQDCIPFVSRNPVKFGYGRLFSGESR